MLQDRLPSEMVKERKKGLQAPDWHVQFVKNRQEIAQELEILSDFDPLKNRVDIQRFQNAMKTLPESGWNEPETVTEYRSVILRTISMGDFIRRISGSNR
jgi:asparagine synthase (glutamine-hydrolysing)